MCHFYDTYVSVMTHVSLIWHMYMYVCLHVRVLEQTCVSAVAAQSDC